MPPLLLPPDLRLSPEQFAQVCDANPEAVLELTADGQLIAMTPTGGDTSARKSLLITQLQIWAVAQGGWIVFDSSGGFRFPDGSVLTRMHPPCGWSAGRPSRQSSGAASRRSAPIW
jgi:Uma2 family endonuclease